jgi:hypothetical protein
MANGPVVLIYCPSDVHCTRKTPVNTVLVGDTLALNLILVSQVGAHRMVNEEFNQCTLPAQRADYVASSVSPQRAKHKEGHGDLA